MQSFGSLVVVKRQKLLNQSVTLVCLHQLWVRYQYNIGNKICQWISKTCVKGIHWFFTQICKQSVIKSTRFFKHSFLWSHILCSRVQTIIGLCKKFDDGRGQGYQRVSKGQHNYTCNWALLSFQMFTGVLSHIKLHLLTTVLLSDFKAHRELWNPLRKAVSGKVSCLHDRAIFDGSRTWQNLSSSLEKSKQNFMYFMRYFVYLWRYIPRVQIILPGLLLTYLHCT